MESPMSDDVLVTAPATEPAAPDVAGDPLLEVDDLHVRFSARDRQVHAVNGLSYRLHAGRLLAIVGESGAGKSVGVRALLGLLPHTAHVSGSARFAGAELVGLPEREMRRVRGADIAMVFQDPTRSLNPTMRIGTQITEAVRAHSDIDRHGARDRAIELLRLVKLAEPERRFLTYPHQLSGGMRQRVMIAIALAAQPRLLVADEATTALDVTTQAQIMELLLELRQRLGMAVIMITHDLGLAASYAQDVLVMYAGKAVEYAPASTLFARVRMPYTRALLGALPVLEREPHTLLPVIPGQPPDLGSLPAGCAFRYRCGVASDECVAPPPFVEHEPGHWWACWHPDGRGLDD
jgi:oligopeptide/dipeptide ABC transporter ATP-binding protein